MPERVTPAMVESELRRLARILETKAGEYEQYARDAAKADASYRSARAKAYLAVAEGSVATREAIADEKCADLYLERRLAEATADACKESMRAVRDQLAAVQSVGSLLKAEMGLAR